MTKKDYFNNIFKSTNGIKTKVIISIKFQIAKIGKCYYVVQTFVLSQKFLEPYMKHNTLIKEKINEYIRNFYLGNIFDKDITYEKQIKYDDLSFAIYYSINGFKNKRIRNDINRYAKLIQNRNVYVELSNKYFIDKNLLGKCESCKFSFDFSTKKTEYQYIKRKGKICKEYEQK